MGRLYIYLLENHQNHPVIVGKHAIRPMDGYRMRLPSMSRALLQQSVYRMVSDGEPLVGAGTGRRYEGGLVSASVWWFRKAGKLRRLRYSVKKKDLKQKNSWEAVETS